MNEAYKQIVNGEDCGAIFFSYAIATMPKNIEYNIRNDYFFMFLMGGEI